MKMSNVFVLSLISLLASTQAGNCHTCFMFPLPSHHPALILSKSAVFAKSHVLPVGLGHTHFIQNRVLEERGATQSQLVSLFRQRFIDRALQIDAARCGNMTPIVPGRGLGQTIIITPNQNQNKNKQKKVVGTG